MKRIKADIILSNCSQVLTLRGGYPKRGSKLKEIGIIEKGWIAIAKDRIVFVGTESEFKKAVEIDFETKWINCEGKICVPGFVDSHNHLPFAGERVDEFRMKLEGASYMEIAEKGGGIKKTFSMTKDISKEELKELSLKRVRKMLSQGTTTSEAKSGYGFFLETEIKQLEVVKEISPLSPLTLVPTFLAHDIPAEYKDRREEYIRYMEEEVLPVIKERELARFFDIFCEKGAFALKESKRLIRKAKELGFEIKVHADEFSTLRGTELGVEEGARSVDHLLEISKEGIKALSKSNTCAVLLPSVPFFLRTKKYAPARKIIDEGGIVALGTDLNPGSSMNYSMLFTLQLSVFEMGLLPEEAICAATINSAYAVGEEKERGSIEKGKKADILVMNIQDYIHIFYELGTNPIEKVIKEGRILDIKEFI
ncbi:MAG: imidazolonepropionase [Candidatus Aminicenantia bacterium]